MSLPVKKDEPTDPIEVGFLRSKAIVPRADFGADAIVSDGPRTGFLTEIVYGGRNGR
jgi:hypothetical protein